MFMLNKIYVFVISLLCFFAVNNVIAQKLGSDTVYSTKEVVISSNRLTGFTTGSKIGEIDSLTLAQNATNSIAELLANQSQVFVKSYSISGLASPSFRGMNAGQTAIIWNGFNIGNSMNGTQDLNILPSNFVNNVKLQFGGAGALWGSGAIGGTIHLLNLPDFDKGLLANVTYTNGSFGDNQINVGLGISKKQFISTIKLFNHIAKNNFPFLNTAKVGKPIDTLKNSEINQQGILQENYLKLTDKQILNFRIWYQTNDRNIPNSITSGIGTANQKDNVLRLTSEWQHINSKVNYFARVGYFDENINYFDPTIKLSSISNIKTFISEIESKIKIGDLQFVNLGVNNTNNIAITKNYTFNPNRNKTAVFGSYQIKNKKSNLKSTLSVRKEFVSDFVNPFTYNWGLEALIYKHFKIRSNFSKSYRLPTFNDLYWGQGGNPNLQPELGYNEEIGIAYIKCVDKFAIDFETSVFNSNVENWIMWVPDSKGVWSPHNISEVWSRGVESDLKLYYTLGKVKLNANFHAQYIKTTTVKSPSKETINKQLMYTPIFKSIANLNLEYKKFRLSVAYNYVGFRYENTDNASFLPGYGLVNIDFSKSFVVNNQLFKAFIQVNNVNNLSYQIITYYPSPMRNYQIGFSVNLNKLNKI